MGTDDRRGGGTGETTDFDAIVVGAGFSGLYMLYRLRELGLSARVFEKADDVGGTWYWNQYPGARCDSESHIYCYSFSEELLAEWAWSERYPEQPEILEYLRFAADRLDLRDEIEFGTAVTSAVYDDDAGTWAVRTEDGTRVSARFLVTAVGCLSTPFVPDFEGLDAFSGEWYHTGRWPHEPVDFGGTRVGLVGTGSSGIQLLPALAEDAAHVTVFQRTPNYAVPARNRPFEPGEFEAIGERYDEIWETARGNPGGFDFGPAYPTVEGLSDEEVERALEERWQAGGHRLLHTFADLRRNPETNAVVSEFIRGKICEAVDDPDVAGTLVPTDHPYGAKRPPLSYYGYYEQYNREDVRLVDVDEAPIERLTRTGIQTADSHHELDAVVFATGFDAMTGTLLRMDLRGRGGLTLKEAWADGPRTYLGLAVPGFPNLFTITGPQSPSVLTNMPQAIEQHVEWIADCVAYLADHSHDCIEATSEAADEWVEHTAALVEGTVYDEAASWYRGENVPGKPTGFLPYPGGLDSYRERCAAVAANGYEGFALGGDDGSATE